MKAKTKKNYIKPLIFMVILIALDQITKLLVSLQLKGKADIAIIKGIFELRYLENNSAAFSLDPVTLLNNLFHFKAFENNPVAFLRAKMIFFVILTVFVIAIIFMIYRKIPVNKRFSPLNFTIECFVAGAIGNCIDRVWHNYVIDFFYFKVINFPVFNVADIYVTLSAIAFFVLLLFYYKEEDFQQIFPKKQS